MPDIESSDVKVDDAIDASALLQVSSTPLERLQHVLHRYPVLSPALVLFFSGLVFTYFGDGRFQDPTTIGIMLQQTAVLATLAIGQTLIILTAGIDLSIGTSMLLVHLVMARMVAFGATVPIVGWVIAPVDPIIGLLLGLLLGLFLGAIHGGLITRLGLPPFIATLGVFYVYQSLGNVYSKAQTTPKELLGDNAETHDVAEGLLLYLGRGISFGSMRITVGVLLTIVLYVVFAYILSSTAWGRHVYATGDDAEAARLAGINTKRVLISVYMVAGLIYAIGGWVQLGRSLSASSNAATDINLETITAVVIGGTSLFGGRGRLFGTLIGAMIVTMFDTGLSLAGVDAFYKNLAIGLLILFAVGLDNWIRKVGKMNENGAPESHMGTAVGHQQPVLQARGLVKRFGRVTALSGADLELYPGEVLAVIGDNGAGKSSLIKCLSGAMTPDEGEMYLNGEPVHFKGPPDAQAVGIETVYQTLAVAPALDIAENMFLGREKLTAGPLGMIFRKVDKRGMRRDAKQALDDLGIGTLQDITQAVETLSGGQRQAVAVARAAAFGSKVVILDEPTAALGVKESGMVLQLVKDLRERGLPVILISHNMPHVFEVADRIHIQRLGKRATVVTPQSHTMADAVAIMTGAAAA